MPGQNLSKHTQCVTCGGDGMVVVGHRLPVRGLYEITHKIEGKLHPSERGFDQAAPCPACNWTTWWEGKRWTYGAMPGEVTVS